MIKKIEYNSDLLAIVISNNHKANGVEFITPNEFSLQMASMGFAKGHKITPHYHINDSEKRHIHYQEVLFIKSGSLEVNFFDDSQNFLLSHNLNTGDTILFVSGGHSFEFTKDTQLIEIKTGPFLNNNSLIKFSSINNNS